MCIYIWIHISDVTMRVGGSPRRGGISSTSYKEEEEQGVSHFYGKFM